MIPLATFPFPHPLLNSGMPRLLLSTASLVSLYCYLSLSLFFSSNYLITLVQQREGTTFLCHPPKKKEASGRRLFNHDDRNEKQRSLKLCKRFDVDNARNNAYILSYLMPCHKIYVRPLSPASSLSKKKIPDRVFSLPSTAAFSSLEDYKVLLELFI